MAKMRASGKRRGTDAGGEPIDLKKDAAKTAINARQEAWRLESEFSRIKRPTAQDRFDYMSDIKRNLRNVQDIKLNKTTFNAGKGLQTKSSTAIPMPAVRVPDKLAGRTVEAGTRSLREGLRAWMRDMRGGGGSRLTGR